MKRIVCLDPRHARRLRFFTSLCLALLSLPLSPARQVLAQPAAEGTDHGKAVAPVQVAKAEKAEQQLVAVIDTTMGTIKARLFQDKAPVTVSNFVELARAGFYNGHLFHRVIEGFMIQTGDPEGTGLGGPGYSFKDEFNADLKHARRGMLSMANSGKDTNGSQFFITLGPTPHLDGRHAIFGEVIEGYDVVEKIAKVETEGTKPLKDVKMRKVEIQGDWFQPVAFQKVKELSSDEIRALSEPKARKVLEGLAPTLEAGKLRAVKFVEARSRYGTVQVSFSAEFEKAKDAKLLLLGTSNGSGFNIERIQFVKE